jgi:CelD/BcsL family acetyltransferase involved in cellulose biosynthesis
VFYDEVAWRSHAEGCLRLPRILVDERPVAFNLCLLDYARLGAMKGGYDEALARPGPGKVLGAARVETCFEQGLEGLELLGDDEPWKRTFATGERRHCDLRAHRHTPRPAAGFAYRRAVGPLLRSAYGGVVRPARGPR